MNTQPSFHSLALLARGALLALAALANVPSGLFLWQARGEPVHLYSCFGSTFPFPLPPLPSLPKTPPPFPPCARGSAAGRGQSGKGARCAPLGLFIGYGVHTKGLGVGSSHVRCRALGKSLKCCPRSLSRPRSALYP